MPLVDPTLAPALGGPQQQSVQSVAALAARVAALERQREIALTPISVGIAVSPTLGGYTPGVLTLPWHGGRTWLIVEAQINFTSGAVSGHAYNITTAYLPSTTPEPGLALSAYPAANVAAASTGLRALQLDSSKLTPGSTSIQFDAQPIYRSEILTVQVNGVAVQWPFP